MSAKEQQDDEREALISIYEGDSSFKEINPTTFQYKFGEDEQLKSFVMELVWGPEYPNELPEVKMDAFYNRNLPADVKSNIISIVNEEGQNWLGCGMTYTLFECLKDRLDELLADVTERTIVTEDLSQKTGSLSIGDPVKAAAPKKEQLSKSQKRKQWNRAEVGASGSKPRGYDWVDIVKHLSQTGFTKEDGPSV